MDLKPVGHRIKEEREARNLTQEQLADLSDLSPSHISIIERGEKTMKLDSFISLANALEVSADTLLVDMVKESVVGFTNELSENLSEMPPEQKTRILEAVKALTKK